MSESPANELEIAGECRICGQALLEPSEDLHHQQKAMIESSICLGCEIFRLEIQVYILRKIGRSEWSLRLEPLMKALLRRYRR